MDKSCHSSGESSTSTSSTNTNSNRDHYLKHLNKHSHKISKPSSSAAAPLIKKPAFESQTQNQSQVHLPQSQSQAQSQSQSQSQSQTNMQAQQHQPPVYNINKNEFRDVVQRLTGSPAHERISTPPPIHPPKPQSSRLQRIRPPPLVHVSNRPPPLLNCAAPNLNPLSLPNPPIPTTAGPTAGFIQRPVAPLSPLPPFPAVLAAAESPVSAYMRLLQNSINTVDSNAKQFSGFSPLAPLVSPRWSNLAVPQQPQAQPQPQQSQPQPQPQPQHQVQQVTSSAVIPSQLLSSPLSFGCLNSPRSPYPLLSPSLLFSPNSGQFGLPLSPTVPVPSPTWRGL